LTGAFAWIYGNCPDIKQDDQAQLSFRGCVIGIERSTELFSDAIRVVHASNGKKIQNLLQSKRWRRSDRYPSLPATRDTDAWRTSA